MKKTILSILAVGLLAGPMVAEAIPTYAIDLEKLVNGYDADSLASAPTFEVGSTLIFQYIVTNMGDAELGFVKVTDSVFGEICSISTLNPGDSATCSLSTAALEGLNVNFGTVVGYGNVPPGPFEDTDAAYYFGKVISAPEPGTLALFGLGLLGLGFARRRKLN